MNLDEIEKRLPYFVRNPNPSLYKTSGYKVIDFETTNKDKGSARNPENRLILGHNTWGRKFSQPLNFDDGSALFQLQDALDTGFLIAHNAKFELHWLRRLGFPLENILVYDTMMAEKVLAGNRLWPLDLDSLSEKYGGKPKDRLIATMMANGVDPADMPRERLQAYCEWDCLNTELIFHKQMGELQKLNLLPVVYTRCLLLPVLVDIECRGMKLDNKRVADEYNRTKQQYDRVVAALSGALNGANPNSPKQLASFLYDVLGFEEVKRYNGEPERTPAGSRKTDKPTLARLSARTKKQGEVLELIKEQAKLDTRLTSVTKFKQCCDESGGVLYGEISQVIPRTHRLSSQGGRYKVQFHNMDRDLKKVIEAREPGCEIGEGDQAQLEFRVATELTQDPQGMEDIANDVDVHSITRDFLQEHGQKFAVEGDKERRTESKPMCVPLNAEILTRSGWKTYHDVEIGEEVLTYNASRNVSEWAPLLEKVYYDAAECVEVGHTHWKTWSTPNHRWYGDKRADHGSFRKYEPCIIETSGITKEHRIYTAAEEHDSPGLPISNCEAAILGWLWSDGSTRISPLTNKASQGKDGRRQLYQAQIIQKKYVTEIQGLLKAVPHTESVDSISGIHRFFLSSPWVRGLYRRTWKGDKQKTILAMNFDQRASWLHAACLAEGTLRQNGEWRLAQNVGDMMEAMRLAAALNGIDTRLSIISKERIPGSNFDNARITLRKQSYVTAQRFAVSRKRTCPVWCPRTKNGTWIMRQGKIITITGNTFRPVYGGTSGTEAEREYCKFFNQKYHVMHRVQSAWEMQVLKSKFLQTITGLRFYWPDICLRRNGLTTEHSSIFNYPVQYFATGEIVPIGMVYLWHYFKASGLKAFLINTVHDSAVWEGPIEEREIISKICQRAMRSCVNEYLKKVYSISLTVPLEVEIAFGSHWGEKTVEVVANG